jgi:stage IV sporulation protein FB
VASHPHFRIAGIPVRIEPIFWVVTALLAFNLDDARLIIIWVAVVLVSVLVHELGHALALKAFGQPSSIVLHGFGGVTLSRRRLGRARSIAVSLAGPVAAMALIGLPAYLVRESDVGTDLRFGYQGGFGLWPLIFFAVYVNVWWSVANLLPIRPLDGGNVMTELVGIDRARILSIGFGAAAAVWAYTHSEAFRYAAFFAAFLAFINFAEYRRSRAGTAAPSAFDVEGPDPATRHRPVGGDHPAPRRPARRAGRPVRPPEQGRVSELTGGLDPSAAESLAWNLLRRSDAAAARRVLSRATAAVDPFLEATVALASDGRVEPLVAAYTANPAGPSNLVPASVVADTGRAVLLAGQLLDAGPAGVQSAGSLQTHLHYAERYADAAAVGELVHEASRTGRAQTAFDVACSWSRAGDADRGLHWLRLAIQDGFAAPRLLDGEPDLAALRVHRLWPEVRGLLG